MDRKEERGREMQKEIRESCREIEMYREREREKCRQKCREKCREREMEIILQRRTDEKIMKYKYFKNLLQFSYNILLAKIFIAEFCS